MIHYNRLFYCILLAVIGSTLFNVYVAFQQNSPLHLTWWLIAVLFGLTFHSLVTIHLPLFRQHHQYNDLYIRAAMLWASVVTGCAAALLWYLIGFDDALTTRVAINAGVSAGFLEFYWCR